MKYCPEYGNDLKKNKINDDDNKTNSIKIENSKGDIIGVGVSGFGYTIGKNIVIGSGTINVNENQLQKIPNEYADALKKFTEILNQQFKDQQVPKEQVQEINNTLQDFAKEVEEVKPEEEEKEKINPGKRRIFNGKFGKVVQTVLKVLPTAAKIGSSLFAPLAPFSDLIGESVQKVVDDFIEK
jgi:coproporphyrinogen III oxidase-like Fe-S oxidoreductase